MIILLSMYSLFQGYIIWPSSSWSISFWIWILWTAIPSQSSHWNLKGLHRFSLPFSYHGSFDYTYFPNKLWVFDFANYWVVHAILHIPLDKDMYILWTYFLNKMIFFVIKKKFKTLIFFQKIFFLSIFYTCLL